MISHFHTSDLLLQCTAVKGSKILRQNTISKRGTCQNYRTFLHYRYDVEAKLTIESGSLSFPQSCVEPCKIFALAICTMHIWHLGRLLVDNIVDLQLDRETSLFIDKVNCIELGVWTVVTLINTTWCNFNLYCQSESTVAEFSCRLQNWMRCLEIL